MINYQEGSATSGTGLLPANTANIVAGLYIARAPVTSFAGVNLGAVTQQHPLSNCRLNYSQVTVDPQKSIDYVQRKCHVTGSTMGGNACIWHP